MLCLHQVEISYPIKDYMFHIYHPRKSRISFTILPRVACDEIELTHVSRITYLHRVSRVPNLPRVACDDRPNSCITCYRPPSCYIKIKRSRI